MHHKIVITIDGPNANLAMEVRDEVVGAVEDFRDSFRPEFNISVGSVEAQYDPSALELAVIEAARRLHARGSGNAIEIYDDAIVRHDENGYFVRAEVWVSHLAIPPVEAEPAPEPPKLGYAAFKQHYIEAQGRAGQKWTMGSLRNAWLAYKDTP